MVRQYARALLWFSLLRHSHSSDISIINPSIHPEPLTNTALQCSALVYCSMLVILDLVSRCCTLPDKNSCDIWSIRKGDDLKKRENAGYRPPPLLGAPCNDGISTSPWSDFASAQCLSVGKWEFSKLLSLFVWWSTDITPALHRSVLYDKTLIGNYFDGGKYWEWW